MFQEQLENGRVKYTWKDMVVVSDNKKLKDITAWTTKGSPFTETRVLYVEIQVRSKS